MPRYVSESEIRAIENEWVRHHTTKPHAVIVLPEGASYQDIRDEWVDVRGFGETHSSFLLANDGRESAIERAKVEYVYDRIDLDELELRVEAALRGRLISHRAALDYYGSLPPGPERMVRW